MANPQFEKRYLSIHEYFELEEFSDIRHEFYEGEVFDMAGTTLVHNVIVNNMADVLKPVFRPKGCQVFTESVKLEVIKNTYYPYPDVMVTCHALDLQSRYSIANPLLLVEVLSKSTANTDRDFKLKKYKKIHSLQHYLLISQYECSIELYSRIEQTDTWTYQVFEEMTDNIPFEKEGFFLPVAEVYDGVVFESTENLPEDTGEK